MSIYYPNGTIIEIGDAGTIRNLSDYGDLSTVGGFNAAFESALSDSSISGISIPTGEYNIIRSLNVRDNFIIKGNNAYIHLRTDNIQAFNINTKKNVLIDGLNIVMHQTIYTTSGNAFHILDSENIIIRNLIVSEVGARVSLVYSTDMTSETDGCKNIVFDNLTLRGIGEKNLSQPSWPYGILAANVRNTLICNCKVTGMSRVSLAFKNYVKNSFMTNNYIEGSLHGLSLASDQPQDEISSEDVVFMGNIVKGCEYPLWIGRTNRFIAANNILCDGQMFMEKCHKSVVNSNMMDNSARTDGQNLIHIDSCDNLMLNNNLYVKNNGGDLFEVFNNPTNVYVNGLFDGKKLDVLNPTSGTPSLT